jgi:hypothetical protein
MSYYEIVSNHGNTKLQSMHPNVSNFIVYDTDWTGFYGFFAIDKSFRHSLLRWNQDVLTAKSTETNSVLCSLYENIKTRENMSIQVI